MKLTQLFHQHHSCQLLKLEVIFVPNIVGIDFNIGILGIHPHRSTTPAQMLQTDD
jgi:hypothetical protein